MGKSYIENSLKRFLKRKVKITLGLVVTFMITGAVAFGGEYTETLTGADDNAYQSIKTTEENKTIYNFTVGDSIKLENNKESYGISLDKNTNEIIINNLYEINLKKEDKANGIYIQEIAGNYTMTGDLNINAVVESGNMKNYCFAKGISLIRANGDTVKIGENNIVNITAKVLNSETGAMARGIEINNSNNKNVIYKIGKGDIEVYSKSSFEGKDTTTYHDLSTAESTGIFYWDENEQSLLEKGSGNITATAESNAYALANGIGIEDGKVKIGEGDIFVSSTGKESAISNGIYSLGTVQKGNGNITAEATGSGTLGAYGIKALNGNENVTIGVTDISTKISGNKDSATEENWSESIGVLAQSGEVNIAGGSITSTAENIDDGAVVYAILTTNHGGNAKVNINQNTSNDVVIYGDILNRSTGTINLNMNTENSVFIGLVNNEGTVNLNLENKATWNNKKVFNDITESNITSLTLNNGIINNDSVDNNISIGTLKGTGGAVNMAAQIGEDGKATSGKVTIGNANDNTQLNVTYTNAGDVEGNGEQAKEYFKDLANNITVTNGKITGNAKLEEGFVSGGYEADFTSQNGNTTVENVTSTGLNSMVEGIRDLATINLLTWRQEMNSLNKRMGELRNSTGEHGVWSRVYTGKIENGSKYDNDYQTYQVGYDKKYTVDNGVMFVGGLVSYTDGETDYALGHGENYSVGAGIYATWLNNDGQFADVVLKQSRLHNKFDVTSKNGNKSQSGDYNNWGTSLSGQYGKRFDLNDKFFVEPSVELTLGRVEDTTYTTSAGVDVHQDTMYSLVGNVGTSVGYKFSDKGNVYARAALVKEFQGDIDTEYEKDGALERTSEDLGDTWAEFGVGVNYRFVENMNVYVDVQKTGEATVDNKWQANLGFRYEF